jgi:hypothetical protein
VERDDYDVLADGAVVGRIMKANAAPVGKAWMLALAFSALVPSREPMHKAHGLRDGGPRRRWRHTCRQGPRTVSEPKSRKAAHLWVERRLNQVHV